jgi:hypothetical protein
MSLASNTVVTTAVSADQESKDKSLPRQWQLCLQLRWQQRTLGLIVSSWVDQRQNVFFAIFQILFSHVPSTICHLSQ